MDSWQTPVADVGPYGDDKGEGGKYFFLLPRQEGEIPDSYFVCRPNTYGVQLVLNT